MYENIRSLSHWTDQHPFGIRFVGETVCDEKFYIERQNSNVTSLEYIVDGFGTLEINGQVLHPERGDMFLLTQGSSHKYYSQKENGWRKYFVSIYGDLLPDLLTAYLPKDTYLFRDCGFGQLFRRMFDLAFNSNDPNTAQTQIALEVFKILNLLYERSVSESEDLADKVKKYIEMNIETAFDLDAVCNRMRYSKNHIINTFSQKFGTTPYRYYLACKTDMAKDYLVNTNMRISEIAALLSYGDAQYFSSCFKKSTGLSPRDYRERLKLSITKL